MNLNRYIKTLNRQQLITILPAPFPIDNLHGDLTKQEQAFKQYLTTNQLGGGIKNHYGIIINTPLPPNIQQDIINACDTSNHNSYHRKQQIMCIINLSLCVLSLVLLIISFWHHTDAIIATIISIINCGCFYLAYYYKRLTIDITKRNHKLIKQLTKFYQPVIKLMKTPMPAINNRPINQTIINDDIKTAHMDKYNNINMFINGMLVDHIINNDNFSSNHNNNNGNWGD